MKRPRLQFWKRSIGHVLAAGGVILFFLATYPSLLGVGAAEAGKSTSSKRLEAAVKVNRTLPNVQPPKPGLQFSAKPTGDEIVRARIFVEPLVPVSSSFNESDNGELAAALINYSKRSSPDDFAGLTTFLDKHPNSPWRASLLLNLGLEYYNTAHYSLALNAWADAWKLSKDATDSKGKAVGDRAAGELAGMYARLGRMTDLETLLGEVQHRVFVGAATERIAAAQAGLANMREHPEIAFKCGPMALHRIKLSLDPKNSGEDIVKRAASTQNGLSLPQVRELSEKMGLNYQMAFREPNAPFVVPSVVHWKVGHYAAVVRQEGDRFLVQDPTFQNDVWATREALEAETSGYFLIPSGKLKDGWRAVDRDEGSRIWGKGNVGNNDPNCTSPKCAKKPKPCGPKGMAVPAVHMMLVSLNIVDEPIGYAPPVGPEVKFPITYNQREANQPTTFTYANFGPKWTFDWVSYITDNPLNPSADVKLFEMGGGTSVFTGFNSTTQTYAPEQYEQDKLTKTSASSYELVSADGSKKIFGQSDGSNGTTRRVLLTQLVDPYGNALTLTYDSNFRVVAITDTIGQVSTISYTDPTDIFRVTKITDPFGRFASFEYDASGRLAKITDVIGLTSQFTYETTSDFINSLITAYGTTNFTKSQAGTTRVLEIQYPNGEKERVEFNQSTTLGTPGSVPASQVPVGMLTHNDYLYYRNTYYWSRDAYATAYPDYTKARLYHWLHTTDVNVAAGILESEKEPLEGRVWYDYAGQGDPIFVGTTGKPTHVGRVLSDGTTQLYTYEYNSFGLVTKSIDPLGRTFSFVYAPNGIDVLEQRQTRGGNNELLSKRTYNGQHQPLTDTDASGKTTAFTYNARGQVLTETNAKNEITTYNYDGNGYLTSVNGPLAGSADSQTFAYDAYGRMASKTDSDGYTIGFEYDALDRLTKVTYPDATFEQFTYTNLDITKTRDRAGRETVSEYDSLRQLATRTDPLNRVTRFEWCKCGGLKSITDPLGRTTRWRNDVQGRVSAKENADGSKISYLYDGATSRLRQVIDEKSQSTSYSYNLDDTVSAVSYSNTAVSTPGVSFIYDPNYRRLTEMTDGSGATRYSYVPITGSNLGAGELDTIDGPLPNDTIKFGYDELQRKTSVAINGVMRSIGFDTLGRIASQTNSLGTFTFGYAGNTMRATSLTYPNGQTTERAYTTNVQDRLLQRITNKKTTTAFSEFLYTYDIPQNQRIHTWSQQVAAQTPSVYTFGYDSADQLTSASVSGGSPNSFGYSYDLASNRLSETVGATAIASNYNSLNELTSSSAAAGTGVTNEWDAEQRLAAVNSGNQRTEFGYDGMGRRVKIRKLINGSEVSDRRFVWVVNEIVEERNAAGAVIKRYFPEGIKIESGPTAGIYFYTIDHLNSVRELTDNSGTVRARYSYDPFGRASKLSGDLDADFGFGGMFWSPEANLNLTKYRAYNPAIGRWLSRDPLSEAELETGPNLYAYVDNNPVNLTDPLGLCPYGSGMYCTDIPTCKDNPSDIFCSGPKPPPQMPAPCPRDDSWCTGPKPPPLPPPPPAPPTCYSQDTFDPWCNKHPKLPDPTPPPLPPNPYPPKPPKPPKPKPPPKPPKKPPPKPPCKK